MVYRCARALCIVTGLLGGGSLFLLGGCSLDDTVAFFRDFNYGGSVLNLTPTEYRWLTSGYQGPGADPEIDPACTYPPFCDNDPFVP